MPTPTPTKRHAAAAVAAHGRHAQPNAFRHLLRDQTPREADHARGVAEVFDTAQDGLALRLLPFGGEEGIGLGVGLGPETVHEARELAVPARAVDAVGEVLGRTRIERLAGPFRLVAVEQPILREMLWTTHHGFPPNSPRSFRAARNRWTRTVDSFNPVIALTSRGVQSP